MKHDKKLHQLLLLKEIPEPSPELELKIMNKISELAEVKSKNKLFLHLSWLFFIIGLTTGIVLTIITLKTVSNNGDRIFLTYPILIAGILIMILLFDRIYNLTAKIRRSNF